MASTSVVVARESFAVGSTVVRKGTTFRKGHPMTEGREELFEPFAPDHDIEQATAAPGEKRNTPRRKKAEEPKEDAKATAAPGETEEKPAPESEAKE